MATGNHHKPLYCRSCGSTLPQDGEFCQYCGTRFLHDQVDAELKGKAAEPGPSPEKRALLPPLKLPDTSIPPRLSTALTRAWDLLTQNMGPGILGAFVIQAIGTFIYLVAPYPMSLFAWVILTPLIVGFYGWAEIIRRGQDSNVESIFQIGINRFFDSIILGALFLLFAMLYFILEAAGYVSLGTVVVSAIIIVLSGVESLNGFMFLTGAVLAVFFIIIIFCLLLAVLSIPILNTLFSLTAWAVANGTSFSESICWAWKRIKAHPFNWWLAGLVTYVIMLLGLIFCIIGVLITIPWGVIAWAELAGDAGDVRNRPDQNNIVTSEITGQDLQGPDDVK